ncbi:phosphoglycolate phosphatase [bacterium BMS3Bbin02]|nr:phosphoglycolate phosphatase [bacterium BMS3Bbin02]
MAHIIWDWNGTLFDDLHIIVESVSACVAPFGRDSITEEDYRDHYTRPVSVFYENLMGRAITQDEWANIDNIFHETYRSLLHGANLAVDADAAIRLLSDQAGTQSILSMWWHSELVPFTAGFGMHDVMKRIDGNRDDTGALKADQMRAHVERLVADHGVVAADVVAVGDTFDDAAAARSVGVPIILYDGGSHHRRELEKVGVPVVSTLMEAVGIASSLV